MTRYWSLLIAVALTVMVAGCGNPGPATIPPDLQSPDAGIPAPSKSNPWTQRRVPPVGIRIPAIHAASRDVAAMGLNKDGTIQVPPLADVQQLGWYDEGPTPGQIGPAVLVAHVDGDGKPGLFIDLGKLTSGAIVDIDRADHTTAVFKVTRVEMLPKTSFPTSAVYGDVDHAALRMITCGGRLDRLHHRFLDQIIAFADLDQIKPTS